MDSFDAPLGRGGDLKGSGKRGGRGGGRGGSVSYSRPIPKFLQEYAQYLGKPKLRFDEEGGAGGGGGGGEDGPTHVDGPELAAKRPLPAAAGSDDVDEEFTQEQLQKMFDEQQRDSSAGPIKPTKRRVKSDDVFNDTLKAKLGGAAGSAAGSEDAAGADAGGVPTVPLPPRVAAPPGSAASAPAAAAAVSEAELDAAGRRRVVFRKPEAKRQRTDGAGAAAAAPAAAAPTVQKSTLSFSDD